MYYLGKRTDMNLSTVTETVDSMSYLGWTTEMNLSTVMETVDQMEPLREIWMRGSSQGKRWG